MPKPGSVIGWKLDRRQRDALLQRFPPRYRNAIADHVTLQTNAESHPLPDPVEAAIVGHADDGDSLEAMVVTIDGKTGRPFFLSSDQVMWNTDPSGRQARESNDLLMHRQWQPLDHIPVKLEPARFP
jgi:hypothetical protein